MLGSAAVHFQTQGLGIRFYTRSSRVCHIFNHRSSDLSLSEGIDFQELNACPVNSRTNKQIANCKAFMCDADCRLEHFDAYDDLASIAERLVHVALPNKECPGRCVACVLFLCR